MSVVAVTGCSGYIGSRLQAFLEDDDRVSKVIGIDVKPPGRATGKLEFHQMDVRDGALARLLEESNVDTVVHLAFIVNPLRNKARMHEIDVGGAANVLRAVSHTRVKHLVVASSTTAFGALPDNPEWLTEEHLPRRQPNYTYASDKFEMETLLREFMSANPGVKVAIVRPCIVYGPNVDNYLSRFLLRLPFFPGVGGARPDMQFVHEDDVAEVFMRILEKGAEGCFHAVGSGTVNIERIAELAGKRMLDLPVGLLYPSVDLLFRLHAPLVEGPSGMLEFIRYRWTASDEISREKLGITAMRSSEEVVRLMLKSKKRARKRRSTA